MYAQYQPISFKMDKLSDNKISTNLTRINQTITKVNSKLKTLKWTILFAHIKSNLYIVVNL